MKKIAVLIPCFNEAKTIAKVVTDYKRILSDSDVYVFDNNSTDGSEEIARKSGAIVIPVYRQGKGFVIAEGFRDVDADVYLLVDGDDTYAAEDTVLLIQPVLEGRADMVVGDRLSSTYFKENKRRFHNMGNLLVRFLVNLLFRNRIKDIMSGARAFSKQFVRSFPILSSGFEVETEMTIHALDKNMMIVELPVKYSDRPLGSVSKLNTFSDGFKVLRTIFILFKDYRPIQFFGLVALLLLFMAIVLFIPIYIQYLELGLVPKIPTLICVIGIVIVSVVSFACGCILDSIKKYNDRTLIVLSNILNKI